MTVRRTHSKAPRQPNARIQAPEQPEFSIIPHDTLKAFYVDLLRFSRSGRRKSASMPPDFVAADVAVAMDLRKDDQLFLDRRRSALEKLWGVSNRGGRPAGSSRSRFEETLRSALGAALLQRTLKHGGISVVFAGAAALARRPDVLESARAHRLPLIFVAEQTHPSDPADLADALRRDLEPGEEMPHIFVDGNDVVAVYRVAHEAMERARRGRGATLIECAAFRVKGQRGFGDPVMMLERYLRGKDMLTRGFKQEAERMASAKRSRKSH